MNITKLLIQVAAQVELKPGERIVSAVPLFGGDKMMLVTDTGRLLSVKMDWY